MYVYYICVLYYKLWYKSPTAYIALGTVLMLHNYYAICTLMQTNLLPNYQT